MNVDSPGIVFTLDLVRGRLDADVRHLCNPNPPAVGRVDQKLANVIHIVAYRRRRPHEDVVDLAAFVDVGDFDATHQNVHHPADVPRLDPVTRGGFELRPDYDLRNPDLLLGMQIDQAGDVLQGLFHLLRLLTQARELGPEYAHDDGIARSGQDLLDPLFQIGLHVAIEPGITGDGGLDAGACRVVVNLRIDADPVFCEIDAVGLVSADGAPDMGAEVAHPRDGADLAAGGLRDPERLRVRGPLGGDPVHQEIPFLELRKQRCPEERPDPEACDDDHEGGCECRAWIPYDPRENRAVAPLEPRDKRRLVLLDGGAIQQNEAQGRRYRQGDHHGGQHREDKGERERLEERPRQPAHEEHRRHGQCDDQRRLPDGGAHFERRFQDDACRRFGASRHAVLAQPPRDVLHVDDRVVHDGTQSDDESRQDHGIDRCAHQIENHPCGHQGQRDRDHADQGHPPFE